MPTSEDASDGDYVSVVAASWGETHKKSALVLLVLLRLQRSPAWSQQIVDWVREVSDGHLGVDPQSLHRALRRLESMNAVVAERQPGRGTGAARKTFRLTLTGEQLLRRHLQTTMSYLWDDDFRAAAARARTGPEGQKANGRSTTRAAAPAEP